MERSVWSQQSGRRRLIGIAYRCCGHTWEYLLPDLKNHTPPACPSCSPQQPPQAAPNLPPPKPAPTPKPAAPPTHPLLIRVCRSFSGNACTLECGHTLTAELARRSYSHRGYSNKQSRYTTFYFCPVCAAIPHPITRPDPNLDPLTSDQKADIRSQGGGRRAL